MLLNTQDCVAPEDREEADGAAQLSLGMITQSRHSKPLALAMFHSMYSSGDVSEVKNNAVIN